MRNYRCRWMKWKSRPAQDPEHAGKMDNIDGHVMPACLFEVVKARIIREYDWPPDEEGVVGHVYLDVRGPLLNASRVVRLRLPRYDVVFHECNAAYLMEWIERGRGRRQEGDVHYIKFQGILWVACIPLEDLPRIKKGIEPHVEAAALAWQKAYAQLAKSPHIHIEGGYGAKEVNE